MAVRAVLASTPADLAGVLPSDIRFIDGWAEEQFERGNVVVLSHMVTNEEHRGAGLGAVLQDFVTDRYLPGTTFAGYVPLFSEDDLGALSYSLVDDPRVSPAPQRAAVVYIERHRDARIGS